MFIVYCTPAGYSLHNDTGKRFALEADARRFVRALRARWGSSAWFEAE